MSGAQWILSFTFNFWKFLHTEIMVRQTTETVFVCLFLFNSGNWLVKRIQQLTLLISFFVDSVFRLFFSIIRSFHWFLANINPIVSVAFHECVRAIWYLTFFYVARYELIKWNCSVFALFISSILCVRVRVCVLI